VPLLPSGKPDVAGLPAPSREDLVGRAPSVPPRNELERRIAEVWADVLGLDAVGVHDNFFDLGGNSLLLSALHARLAAELGGDLPIQRLFEHPTVHALAASMSSPPSGPASEAPGGTGGNGDADARPSERAANARRARSVRQPPKTR
jgi:aryl carrier-like protein